MRLPVMLLLGTVLSIPPCLSAQDTRDSVAIVAVARDYIDGYYTGDAVRVGKALHPLLAKRMAVQNGWSGETELVEITAAQMITITRQGGGSGLPSERKQSEIQILDIHHNTATLKITTQDWIDYAHLARIDGHWVIVNVLWELTPK